MGGVSVWVVWGEIMGDVSKSRLWVHGIVGVLHVWCSPWVMCVYGWMGSVGMSCVSVMHVGAWVVWMHG